MVEYLHRARGDWHDNPAIQTGLDRHTEPTMKLLDVWASDERERVKRDGPTFSLILGRACAAEGWGGDPFGEEVSRF